MIDPLSTMKQSLFIIVMYIVISGLSYILTRDSIVLPSCLLTIISGLYIYITYRDSGKLKAVRAFLHVLVCFLLTACLVQSAIHLRKSREKGIGTNCEYNEDGGGSEFLFI